MYNKYYSIKFIIELIYLYSSVNDILVIYFDILYLCEYDFNICIVLLYVSPKYIFNY